MKKLSIFLLILFFPCLSYSKIFIYLKNGNKIQVDGYWQRENQICFEKYNGTICLGKDSIAKIEEKEKKIVAKKKTIKKRVNNKVDKTLEDAYKELIETMKLLKWAKQYVNEHTFLRYLSCYQIGYYWGRCATKSYFGLPCNPRYDFAIPERCRGKLETMKGVYDGVKEVYKSLGLLR